MLNHIHQSPVPSSSAQYPENSTTLDRGIQQPDRFFAAGDAVSLNPPDPSAGLRHFINRIEGALGRMLDLRSMDDAGPYKPATTPASLAGRFLRAIESHLFGAGQDRLSAPSALPVSMENSSAAPDSQNEPVAVPLPDTVETAPAIEATDSPIQQTDSDLSPALPQSVGMDHVAEGVDQGYLQTLADFSGTDYSQTIMEAVDQAHGLIKQGIEDIKARSNGVETGNYSYKAAAFDETRNISLTILTRDGDKVTIDIHQARGAGGSQLEMTGSDGTSKSAEQYSYSDGRLAFSINGNLDADEVTAIRELIDNVAGLAKTFYSSDFEKALGQASAIGFDSTELSGFALDMDYRQTQYTASAEQYSGGGRKHRQGWGSNVIPGDIADRLRHGMDRTHRLMKTPALGRLENPRRLIRDLFEALGKQFETASGNSSSNPGSLAGQFKNEVIADLFSAISSGTESPEMLQNVDAYV